MKARKSKPLIGVEHDTGKSENKFLTLLVVLASLALTIGICAWLWRVEWLRPWLASGGAAVVALLGPIPGLLDSKMRAKWVVLVVVAALIGGGTWYASKSEEDQRDEARGKESFSELLLSKLPANLKDELCMGVARRLQQLVHHGRYEELARDTAILRALSPANGHALYFEGEADLGLRNDGGMLTDFKSYLFNADKHPAEAYDGDADKCYERISGYCGERTAWIEHHMANYFFARAKTSSGSQRIDELQQVVTHIRYMIRARKIGFNADKTTHDSTDLLRQSAEQLQGLAQDSAGAEALSLLTQINEERRKAAASQPRP